jgi:hypothetical protein
MQQEAILWTFVLHVLLPFVVLSIIQRILLQYHKVQYAKAGVSIHYLEPSYAKERKVLEAKDPYKELKLLSDIRFAVRLMSLPLLILLFFNFQNTL